MTMTRILQFLLLCVAFATGTAQDSSLLSSPSKGVRAPRKAATVVENGNPSTRSSTAQSGVRGGGSSTGSLEARQQTRFLMNNKGMGGGNSNGNNNNNNNFGAREGDANANGLIEPGFCVSWDLQGTKDRANSEFTDDECKTNSCGGGCCRVYNWLICDTSNGYSHLQCVCNGNTDPVPAPTLPPPTTAAPVTPFPTTVAPAPTTAAPAPTTTAPAPTTTAPATTTDREDDPAGLTIDTTTPAPFQAGTFPLTTQPPATATPPPVTAAPVTAAPVTQPPVTQPPVTAAPVTAPPTDAPGPIEAWQQCAAGSQYHAQFSNINNGLCHYAEDCDGGDKNHCCIRTFCLCGNPGALTSECVPARFEK